MKIRTKHTLIGLAFSVLFLLFTGAVYGHELDRYEKRYLLADSLIRSGETGAAITIYESLFWSFGEHQNNELMVGAMHRMGDLYLAAGDTSFAKGIFEKSVSVSKELQDSFFLSLSYNQLGRLYLKKEQHKTGIYYLEQSFTLAEQQGDEITMATLLNNLAGAYRKTRCYEEAIKALEKSLALSLAIDSKVGLPHIYLNLYHTYTDLNDKNEAMKWLEAAYIAAKDLNNIEVLSQVELAYYETHKSEGDLPKALAHYEAFIGLENKRLNANFEQKIIAHKKQWENFKTASMIARLALEAESSRKSSNIRSIIIGGLILFAVLLCYIVVRGIKGRRIIQNLFRNELEKQRELKKQAIELEKLRSESKSRQILMNKMIRTKKNEVIKHIEETLENFLAKEDITLLVNLKAEIKSKRELNQDWDTFLVHFNNVHPNFLKSMKAKYPALTQNNLRLAAYIKMGLENREISNLMSITIESVKSAKKRLKKKLQMSPGELFVFEG